MKAIHRSILTRALMTGAASLAVMMATAAGARADIVTVQGEDGPAGAGAINSGEDGGAGGDGESVAANGKPASDHVPLKSGHGNRRWRRRRRKWHLRPG
jgi:hypothetical protein